MRHALSAFAFGAVAVVSLAACTSSSGAVHSTAAAAPGTTAAGGSTPTTPAVVRIVSTKLGPVLADSVGRTLYVFSLDRAGRPACSGGCLHAWPVVAVASSDPLPPAGVTARLGATSGTAAALTIDGYVVHTFVGDTSTGSTAGEGEALSGGRWWALNPAGTWITRPSGRSAAGRTAAPGGQPTTVHSSTAHSGPSTHPSTHHTTTPPRSSPPHTTPPPHSSPAPSPTGIPQNNGGDHDADNNGGPSDGDGDV